jgi:hypothetical protein
MQLKDLRVRLRGRENPPELIDSNCRRIHPVHLGAVVPRYLPSLAKFLALFGPGELRRWAPYGKQVQRHEHLSMIFRHRIGNVIYHRKAWIVSLDSLRSVLLGKSGSSAFAAIDRWRSQVDIPERIFVSEHRQSGGRKPQYIDFTSCLFVELFRSIVESAPPNLRITEALPSPRDFWGGDVNVKWAVELQLESTMLRCGVSSFNTEGVSSAHSSWA